MRKFSECEYGCCRFSQAFVCARSQMRCSTRPSAHVSHDTTQTNRSTKVPRNWPVKSLHQRSTESTREITRHDSNTSTDEHDLRFIKLYVVPGYRFLKHEFQNLEVVLICASRHVAFYLLTKGFTCTTWSTSHHSRGTKSSGTYAQKIERDTFTLKRSDNSTGSPITVSFCNDFSSLIMMMCPTISGANHTCGRFPPARFPTSLLVATWNTAFSTSLS